MRSLLLALLLAHLTGLSGCSADPARVVRPMSKGVELYSWLDPATQNWCFALLPATNRNKTAVEIRGSGDVVHSVADLEDAISQLTPSESIFWAAPDTGEFSLPPAEVVDGIIEYAASLDVSVWLMTK